MNLLQLELAAINDDYVTVHPDIDLETLDLRSKESCCWCHTKADVPCVKQFA
jgi:hypothetical protein